ncbi:hypothetical protein SAY87_002870 [Trapa incisa]|uniref:Uncharacterized protein n=1 Tax=Trapa incisa TaxID=236973 RepID=A0AAN7KMA5_9MYRT|nr:hypothetical protein SAY87_002870 [Trapa incisa]
MKRNYERKTFLEALGAIGTGLLGGDRGSGADARWWRSGSGLLEASFSEHRVRPGVHHRAPYLPHREHLQVRRDRLQTLSFGAVDAGTSDGLRRGQAHSSGIDTKTTRALVYSNHHLTDSFTQYLAQITSMRGQISIHSPWLFRFDGFMLRLSTGAPQQFPILTPFRFLLSLSLSLSLEEEKETVRSFPCRVGSGL